MGGQRSTKFTEHWRRIYDAQNERCPLCGGWMVWGEASSYYRDMGFTKEHVFPRCSARKGIHNGVILTHPNCNNTRGSQRPTPCLVLYAAVVYERIGLVPFERSERRYA